MTTLDDSAPLADFRTHVSAYIDSAQRTHQRVTITRHGQRAAVLLGADDYDGLMETLDLLQTPGATEEILESLAQADRGETMSWEDTLRELGREDLIR